MPQCHLDFTQWEKNYRRDNTYYISVMDSNKIQANVQVRIIETDNKEKSHKCNQCEYATSHTSALRAHLKTHSGEKSNKCNQCDYATLRTVDLRTHLKTHSGEKSNKCIQCNFATSQAGNMITHMKTHTLEKGCSSATSADMPSLRLAVWRCIWRYTQGKSFTNVINASMHPMGQAT